MMDKNQEQQHPKYSNLRQILPQILAVCVKNFVLLIHGMSLGFPTILIPGVSGNDRNEPILLGQEEVSWIGSINLIFVPIGCLVSGSLTQVIGRKRAMQVATVPFLIAWLIFYFSNKAWHIFVAASLMGLGGGVLEAPVLTYVAEITQPHLRGILSSTSTMTLTVGMLSQFVFGAVMKWRTVTLINGTIPILSFILLMFVPETPTWLITKNRLEEAKRSLAWLRGWTSVEHVQDEFQQLCKEIKIEEREDNSISGILKAKLRNARLFAKSNFLRPITLIGFTFILGSFNGHAPFQVYAIKIFKVMKSPLNEYHSTIIVGVVQTLGSIISLSLIHVLGKRKLNFLSLVGCGVCCLVVATYAYMHDITHFNNNITNTTITNFEPSPTHTLIPVIFLIIFAFLAYLGIKLLPWILIGELFAVEIRATASGLSAASGYIFSFIANKTFLNMVSMFSIPAVFWFYGAVAVIGTVVLYFVLPETEGKTLYEISEHFAGRNKLRNSVRKGKEINTGISNVAFESELYENKIESKL